MLPLKFGYGKFTVQSKTPVVRIKTFSAHSPHVQMRSC